MNEDALPPGTIVETPYGVLVLILGSSFDPFYRLEYQIYNTVLKGIQWYTPLIHEKPLKVIQ